MIRPELPLRGQIAAKLSHVSLERASAVHLNHCGCGLNRQVLRNDRVAREIQDTGGQRNEHEQAADGQPTVPRDQHAGLRDD